MVQHESNSHSHRVLRTLIILCEIVDYMIMQVLSLSLAWSRLLTLIGRLNKSLHAKHLSVLDASKMVKGLVDTLKNLRDSESSFVLSKPRM